MKDRVVLITGARGGLGSFVTQRFLTTGVRVVGTSRSISYQDSPEPNFAPLPVDFTKAPAVRMVELESKAAGLTANLILPGTMDTPANRKAMPDADPSKWVQPGAVADLALFLAEDRAAQVTGTVIPIDGTNV